jgi:hypothetical protein
MGSNSSASCVVKGGDQCKLHQEIICLTLSSSKSNVNHPCGWNINIQLSTKNIIKVLGGPVVYEFLEHETPSNSNHIRVARHDMYKIELFIAFAWELSNRIRMSRERSSKKLVIQRVHSIWRKNQSFLHTSRDRWLFIRSVKNNFWFRYRSWSVSKYFYHQKRCGSMSKSTLTPSV